MICIYIHGRHFVNDIMNGIKTMETRNGWSLFRFVGMTVGVILTGCGKPKLVGTVEITGYDYMKDQEEFRAKEAYHLVKPGSRYDCKPYGAKVGYWLKNPVRLDQEVELEPIRGNRIWRHLGSFRDRDIKTALQHEKEGLV